MRCPNLRGGGHALRSRRHGHLGYSLKLDSAKLIIFFGLPMAVMSVLIAMCFSGVRILETIVVMPYLESIAAASRRELGLLENLQNVLILAALIVAVRAAWKTKVRGARFFFGVFAAGRLFMLLEDID